MTTTQAEAVETEAERLAAERHARIVALVDAAPPFTPAQRALFGRLFADK